MTMSRKIKAAVGLSVGCVILFALFAWQGVEIVAGILAEAGIILLLVCPFAVPDQILSAESWRVLFPPQSRPPRVRTILASWMGSSVNTLLPVATIGGELVKTRVLVLWSHSGPEATAAMTADKTIQAIAVLLWGLVGTMFLAAHVGLTAVVTGILFGAGLLAAGIVGFILVQLKGGISKIADAIALHTDREHGASLVGGAATLEESIREIYAHPRRLVAATVFRVGQRVLLVGEVVLASHLMGFPIGLMEAVILKGIIGTIRGMSFAVPAGLGIQEGGYVAIGALLGHSPELMIAVSLATRLREVLPNLPFLYVWQAMEGRAFTRRMKADGEGAPD